MRPGRGELAFAKDDPPLGQVIWREFHAHFVAGNDTDEILAHFASHVGQHLVTGLELDAKPRICQRLHHGAEDFKSSFFFGHAMVNRGYQRDGTRRRIQLI